MNIEIYTDGSAQTVKDPGGWAFLLVIDGKKTIEQSGHMEHASNNDAEAAAAIQGLSFLLKRFTDHNENPKKHVITLVSDSQLILGWASGRFKVSSAKADVVVKLRSLVDALGAKTRWVKGHSGNEYNNRCDKLAKQARKNTVAEPAQCNTKIGHKKEGVFCMWYGPTLMIIDLDSKTIEEYDKSLHGSRSSRLEVKNDK